MNTIELKKVLYMPKVLEPGMLYVSEEYKVAAHLCACGCGNKVVTPLSPTEWSLFDQNGKPTLNPSIGNWQLPCRSHYCIINGVIEWSGQWTEKQIKSGWKNEEKRRKVYYKNLNRKDGKSSIFLKLRKWLFGK